jgi:5-methylcytosine-specific restriction protein A
MENQEKLVWYACYGSNIMYERFMYYIKGGIFEITGKKHDGCADKTPPRSSKSIIIPYEMYFANQAKYWDECGVAFLDTSITGVTLGRMYLRTILPIEEVWKQECKSGDWYNKIIGLGCVHTK